MRKIIETKLVETEREREGQTDIHAHTHTHTEHLVIALTFARQVALKTK